MRPLRGLVDKVGEEVHTTNSTSSSKEIATGKTESTPELAANTTTSTLSNCEEKKEALSYTRLVITTQKTG
jgi:hypothetical protein